MFSVILYIFSVIFLIFSYNEIENIRKALGDGNIGCGGVYVDSLYIVVSFKDLF